MKKEEQEGLRFKYVESEAFMGLPNTVLHIDGKSFIISGRNEAGKSRFIQMLLSGIDPKSQATEIVTKGETKASTKVVIAGTLGGEPMEYTISMYYSPKNQSGRIVLTDKKGDAVKSPKEVLKNLIGNISFDVFKFLNDTKANKIKILKQLSGVEKDIDILNMQRKEIYDSRTYLNKKVEENEALMNNHGLSPEEIDLYSEPLPIQPIQEELNSISKKITDWNDVKRKTDAFKLEFEVNIPKEIQECDVIIKSKEEQILKLQEEIADLKLVVKAKKMQVSEVESKYKKGNDWLTKNPEPKAEEISKRLNEATTHNNNHEKIKALAEKQKALMSDKKTLQKHTDDINAIDEKKSDLIAKSKLPVKGLSFSDEEIFYNGLPFEEKQLNTATLLDVGIEIAKSLNPGLRTIFIHSGSLFDKRHLNKVIKKAEKDGYQVICEVVHDEGDLEIKFLEEEGEQ